MSSRVRIICRKVLDWVLMDEHEKLDEEYFSMSLAGLSMFFARLDPAVMAGVHFDIVDEGILVKAYIPPSQLKNLLVVED